MTSNKQLLEMDSQALLDLIPAEKKQLIRDFIHEMNRRE